MISAIRKIHLTVIGFAVIFILLILAGIFPAWRSVDKKFNSLSQQRGTFNVLQKQVDAVGDFRLHSVIIKPTLEKLSKSFINFEAPIEWIEFLEQEAQGSKLAMEIYPLPSAQDEKTSWIDAEFRLILGGRFPDCLRFFKKVENGPWLVEFLQLNVARVSGGKKLSEKFVNLKEGEVLATLDIRAFAKKVEVAKQNDINKD